MKFLFIEGTGDLEKQIPRIVVVLSTRKEGIINGIMKLTTCWNQSATVGNTNVTQPFTFFLPAQDQNCKRVLRVQCFELCRLPYILMLLMMSCIRKTRASLVTINRGAHVVNKLADAVVC